MAVSVEEISKVLAGEGNQVSDENMQMAKTLSDMFEQDVSGLKRTNVLLKEEKTEIKNKWEADQQKFAEAEKTLQEQLKAAEEQLEKGNPDEKKHYDTKLALLEQSYKSQLAERDTKISERDKEIEGYKQNAILTSMRDEFRKAALNKNVANDSLELLEYYILGDKGNNFIQKDTSEGEKIFWAKDGSGDDIQIRLDKFLKTPLGMRFVPFNSNGSGAEGGLGGGNAGGKTMTNAEFLKLTPAERREAINKGVKIVN